MRKLIILVVSLIFSVTVFAKKHHRNLHEQGQSKPKRIIASTQSLNDFPEIRSLVESGKNDEAHKRFNKIIESPKDEFQLGLARFAQGILYFNENKDKEAEENLLEANKHAVFEDYIRFHLGLIYKRNNRLSEAQSEFIKVRSLNPNQQGLLEAIYQMSLSAMELEHWKLAKQNLTYLEKRMRSRELYPELLWNLVKVEKKMHNTGAACKWARKIYSKYPSYQQVKDWGMDLSRATFEGKYLGCAASLGDLEKRIRRLQWSGESERARQEIEVLKQRSNQYSTDKVLASFLMYEGQTQDALKILLPYFSSHQHDFSYLMLLARVAASAGEVQTAVGSYYHAYQLSPKGKKGRQALYQAAFLSYQFQDYDGAGRKFEEFIRKYSRSGLSKEGQWHLAWIRYLKNDYDGAYRNFSQILKEKQRSPRAWKSVSSERIRYWMGMSLLRMGKKEEAKQLFLPISKSRELGYYFVAAQARLEKLANVKADESKPLLAENENGTPIDDIAEATQMKVPEGDTKEENESEEGWQTAAEDEDDDNGNGPSLAQDAVTIPELPGVVTDNGVQPGRPDPILLEMESPQVTDFKDPRLANRFERARVLMALGFKDWARWDLYEIERRTANKTYLRALMSEYEASGFYNRSSYIGQIQFGSMREREGVDGAPYLWKYAYPQAYKKDVENNSAKFNVPQELVWSIMRAESQYRVDVMSPVGAMGLMQIMPHTGGRVAELLNEKDKFEVSLLGKADSNIKYGARYLKRLSERFDSKIPLVAASYNAGPHRVYSWLESFGVLDMDEFVEHVPLVETRNYIKKVVSNFYIYSRLYGKEKEPKAIGSLAEPLKIPLPEASIKKEIW